jgi:hypothetical protein
MSKRIEFSAIGTLDQLTAQLSEADLDELRLLRSRIRDADAVLRSVMQRRIREERKQALEKAANV